MTVKKNNALVAFMVWLSITMFYCYQYIVRILPNIIEPNLKAKYDISVSDFADFAGLYYIGYVAVHIPIGIALGRFGAKKIMPLFIFFTAAGLLPIVFSDSWTMVIAGRILNGIGASAASVGALQTFRIMYPDKFARVLGFTVCTGIITAVYISSPLAEVIENIGFDLTLQIIMYSGTALAIISFIIIPKSEGENQDSNILGDIKFILSNYKLLLASLFAGLMVGPLEGFGDAWGSKFMIAVYALEKVSADTITLSISLGMCAGCIILPYIADKTRMYIGVTMLSGIAMILCFMHILGEEATENSLYYTCFATGIFCAYQVIIIPKITTYVPEEKSGLAAAVANMIIMAFGSLFHKAIASRLDQNWNGQMNNGTKLYDNEAYVAAISVIPIAIAIAVIGFALHTIISVMRAKRIQEATISE